LTLARSILVFLGALIFSVLLWAYVRLSALNETDVDLPIKLTPPKGYALASGLPERLHTRVRGAGWQILLMNFTKNADFRFDLTDRVVPAGERLVIHSDELANSASLPSEVHVMKVDPDSLLLDFGKAVEKRVPIVPELDIEPARGYMIVNPPDLSPREITIVGAASVLDSLRSMPTQRISVRNAREDVERVVPLTDSLANFVSVPNPPKIDVRVDVEALGERKIANIPIVVEALPPQFELVLIPGSIAVTVRGGVDQLAKLVPSVVHAHVMYNPITFDTASAIVPEVEVPREMTFLMSDPPSVRFILRKKTESAAASDHPGGRRGTP